MPTGPCCRRWLTWRRTPTGTSMRRTAFSFPERSLGRAHWSAQGARHEYRISPDREASAHRADASFGSIAARTWGMGHALCPSALGIGCRQARPPRPGRAVDSGRDVCLLRPGTSPAADSPPRGCGAGPWIYGPLAAATGLPLRRLCMATEQAGRTRPIPPTTEARGRLTYDFWIFRTFGEKNAFSLHNRSSVCQRGLLLRNFMPAFDIKTCRFGPFHQNYGRSRFFPFREQNPGSAGSCPAKF